MREDLAQHLHVTLFSLDYEFTAASHDLGIKPLLEHSEIVVALPEECKLVKIEEWYPFSHNPYDTPMTLVVKATNILTTSLSITSGIWLPDPLAVS